MKIRLKPTIFSELSYSAMKHSIEIGVNEAQSMDHFTLCSDGTGTYVTEHGTEEGFKWFGITWEELLYMVEGRYTVVEDISSGMEDTSPERLKLGSKMKEIPLPVCLSKEDQMVLIQKLMEDSVIFTLHHEWEEKVEIIIPLYNVQKTFNLLSLRMDLFDAYMKDIYDETVETTYGWENPLSVTKPLNVAPAEYRCPSCGCSDLEEFEEVNSTFSWDGTAEAHIMCSICGTEWVEYYRRVK